MGERLVAATVVALTLLVRGPAVAADPPIPTPQGFVNDLAGILPPATQTRLTRLLEELRAKTGAEIAVLTVDTTAPLDDFSYAMRVAEAWKPGRKRDDTGIVFLVAVRDRKLRILTGYGLEGILPDGLIGAIEDEEIVPAFRAGRMDEGIERGVRALASRIAADRGVTLTGVPPPRPRPAPPNPWITAIVLAGLLVFVLLMLYGASQQPRLRRGRSVFPIPFPGPFGGGGGGFGGGGGGFDGFGGGGFGGGGAGRSW